MADYYLLVVDDDRGRPKFNLYQASSVNTTGVEPTALTSASLGLPGITTQSGDGISGQFTEPNGLSTFSISVSEP